MKVGFIGLGNAGGKLAGSLLRNGFDLTVRDLNKEFVDEFVQRGAKSGSSPKEMAEHCDVMITCLPSPKACSEVMESKDGILAGLSKGKIWLEMSTTDEAEIKRLEPSVAAKTALLSPDSGIVDSHFVMKHFFAVLYLLLLTSCSNNDPIINNPNLPNYTFDTETSKILINSNILDLIRDSFHGIIYQKSVHKPKHLYAFLKEHDRLQNAWEQIESN